MVRTIPLVTAYAGAPDLAERVEDGLRVTQNDPRAVAWGGAAARILERVVCSGVPPSEAARAEASQLLAAAEGAGGGESAAIGQIGRAHV